MDINGNNKNGSGESPTQVAETPEPKASERFVEAPEPVDREVHSVPPLGIAGHYARSVAGVGQRGNFDRLLIEPRRTIPWSGTCDRDG